MMARRGGTAGANRSGRVRPLVAQVFDRLSDGHLHSGQALAEALHVSRGAVWKAVRALRSAGMIVHAVPNRGYRLPVAGEPIGAELILERLPPDARAAVRDLQVLW